MNKFVYNQDIDKKIVMETSGRLLMTFLSAVTSKMLINMIGMLYVKAEILLKGNENLLNESSEGIVIIEKQNGMD